MMRFVLVIHMEKSRIIFCGRNNESVLEGVETSFVFLGYFFRSRQVKSTGDIYFMGFILAISIEVSYGFWEKIRNMMRRAKTMDIVILSRY